MNTLEECNLLDNTLIIYASDHGEQIGERDNKGKRRRRGVGKQKGIGGIQKLLPKSQKTFVFLPKNWCFVIST